MIWGTIQLVDLIKNHQMHFFLFFMLFVWGIFLIKWLYSKKYRPYTDAFRTSHSVIVPVFQEDMDTFTDCMETIMGNHPDDIIVVIDEREKGRYEEYLDTQNIRYDYAPPGKREAVAKGIRDTGGEVVIIVDSDTLFTANTIEEILKPFIDPAVGGVTPEQRILDWDKSASRRIADWMEDFRWKVSNRAMSAKGVIGCLPGRAIALRREAIEPVLDDFLTETFRGKKCVIGDDRYMTSLILNQGYKSVFQSSTRVYTTVPDDFRKFLKMNLRWSRSSQRETVKALSWYIKKPFILPLSFFSDILVPFLFVAVILMSVTNIIWRYDPVDMVHGTIYDQLWAGMLIGMIGMTISLGLRHAIHLAGRKRDILFLPVWVLFMTFIMLPIRIAGFFTMGKQEWMTR